MRRWCLSEVLCDSVRGRLSAPSCAHLRISHDPRPTSSTARPPVHPPTHPSTHPAPFACTSVGIITGCVLAGATSALGGAKPKSA